MSYSKLLFVYLSPQGELDRERFTTDLKRTAETHSGYKAELRMFVSKGERDVPPVKSWFHIIPFDYKQN